MTLRRSVNGITLALTSFLLGCPAKPVPPVPSSHVSHITLSPIGYPTQTYANGDVVEWDVQGGGYTDYTIVFEDAGPCGEQLTIQGEPADPASGKPADPAHCTVQGQSGLSKYFYTTIINYPDGRSIVSPKSTVSITEKKVIFRAVGCNACPAVAGVATFSNQLNIKSVSPGGPAPQAALGAPLKQSLNTAKANDDPPPGEQDFWCSGNQTFVDPTGPSYQQGTQIFWQPVKGFHTPVINFPGDSPCMAKPVAPEYSCILRGARTPPYTYTISTTDGCKVPASAAITVTP